MKAALDTKFKQHYATHLKHLKLQGLRPKTIDAYARAVRYIWAYFDYAIDDLTEAQLTDYFHEVVQARSASERPALRARNHAYAWVSRCLPAAHGSPQTTLRDGRRLQRTVADKRAEEIEPDTG